MKICFLTHNLKQDNGAGVFSKRFIEGMRERFKCEVVALTTESSGLPYEKPILYPSKKMLLWELFRIRRIMKECDIIHALDAYPYGVIALLLSFGLGKKIIITAIGSGALIHLYKPFYSFFLTLAYKKADAVTAISTFTKREIEKKIKRLSVEVINHGVDVDKYQHNTNNTNSAFHFNNIINSGTQTLQTIEDYKPYILSVGALRGRKGYHASIRAFARVRAAFPRLHYVIVGKKFGVKYYQKLQRIINERSLQHWVHVMENVHTEEELIMWYRNAELFCLFSQNINNDVEGFGLVFLEAAASGLAVVGSKNCGAEDAIQDGENGFVIDQRDENGFADAIIKILKDKELRARMQNASLVFARESTWEKRFNDYARVYNRVLEFSEVRLH